MMKRILSKHAGFIAVGSGLIAASLYVLMITVTLAHIQEISGQVPFDMRPFGYGPTEAATLLNSLGAEGREYYLSRQIPLDTLYPAMLALTLISTILWFGQRMPNRRPIHIGVALSTGSALLDYVENLGILAMIQSWPEVSVPLIYAASTATILKSIATTLAVVLVLLVGFQRARQSRCRHSLIPRYQQLRPRNPTFVFGSPISLCRRAAQGAQHTPPQKGAKPCFAPFIHVCATSAASIASNASRALARISSSVASCIGCGTST